MDLDSVLRVAPEGFDGKVSLDPFEERLYLPSVAVDVGNHKRPEFKVVGQEGDNFFFPSIIELYQAQVIRILFPADVTGKANGIIPDNPYKVIDVVVGVYHLILHRSLGPGNEVGLVDGHPVKGFKVHIGLVHRVDCPFVGLIHIQEVAVVIPAVRDIDGVRYASSQVQDRMHLDATFRVLANVNLTYFCIINYQV